MNSNELWVPMRGWEELYEVSTLGKVRSLVRYGRTRLGRRKYGGKVLSVFMATNGYAQVNITGNGKRKSILVHRAVLESFIGPPPSGMEACHNNGNKMDCRVDNLRWDTRKGNHADKRMHGTHPSGENNPAHKLREVDVKRLRRSHGVYELCAIAKELGVSRGCVEKAKYGGSWANVKE